ncbi:MAG: hypothetical protein U0T73_11380 [Chitinophagales bacterium]
MPLKKCLGLLIFFQSTQVFCQDTVSSKLGKAFVWTIESGDPATAIYSNNFFRALLPVFHVPLQAALHFQTELRIPENWQIHPEWPLNTSMTARDSSQILARPDSRFQGYVAAYNPESACVTITAIGGVFKNECVEFLSGKQIVQWSYIEKGGNFSAVKNIPEGTYDLTIFRDEKVFHIPHLTIR